MSANKYLLVLIFLLFIFFAKQAQLAAPVSTDLQPEQRGVPFRPTSPTMLPQTTDVSGNDATNKSSRTGLKDHSKSTSPSTSDENTMISRKQPNRNAKISSNEMNHSLQFVRKNAAEARAEMRMISKKVQMLYRKKSKLSRD
jgi:hypothetical protein